MIVNQDLAWFEGAMPMIAADVQGRHPPSPDENPDVSFLPKALIDNCTPFVVRYHELNGFSCLPDIFWQPETRKLIEGNPALRELFKKSTSSRRARKANERFVLIATLILNSNGARRPPFVDVQL